ncbi:MAG: 4Fe-4S double cluster binding domain-containing protein, partial [Balneolaceae bacterium]
LLNREYGSWFLLGEILMDLELEPDAPITDHCGSCTKCIDACPTDAIYEPYRVDGSRCISYLTIELKDKIPEEYRDSSGDWIFGCDICQDVCPWNRKASVGQIDDLQPREKISNSDLSFWKSLTYDEYEELFNGTPVRRARFPKLKQNIANAIQNLESVEES